MTTEAAEGSTGPQTTGRAGVKLIQVLNRRRGVIFAVVLGAVLASGLAAMQGTRPYEARSVLQVQATSVSPFQGGDVNLDYTDRVLNTYTQRGLDAGDPLHDAVLQRLNASAPLRLATESPANTGLLVIRARAEDPQLAARAANGLAEILFEDLRANLGQQLDSVVQSLEAQIDAVDERLEALREEGSSESRLEPVLAERADLVRTYNETVAASAARTSGVSIVESADAPGTRTGLSPLVLAGLGGFFGIAGGLAFALVIDRLDRTVFDVAGAVSERGYPVLGTVGAHTASGVRGFRADMWDTSPLDPHAVALAFRLRRTSVRSLMLVPPFHRPDMAGVTAEMARALASTGLEVTAVDATTEPVVRQLTDSRDRPDPRDRSPGSPLRELAVPAGHAHIRLIPGRGRNDETAIAVEDVSPLEELVDTSDVVVFHGPPLLEGADSSLLSRQVEATVLIVESALLHEDDLDQALDQAIALPSRFLGVVVVRPAKGRRSRGGRPRSGRRRNARR